LPITVFSDFVCPYSYVVESTLYELDQDRVELRFRATDTVPVGAKGTPAPGDSGETLRALADEAGVVIRTNPLGARTWKAHEATHFARQVGQEIELRRGIFDAYLRDGLDIGRIDVLTSLAPAAGIDPIGLKIALDIDRFQRDVQADIDLAARLRITATPTIFLGSGKSARILVGALGSEALRLLVLGTIQNATANE